MEFDFRIVNEECYPYRAASNVCKIRNKDTLITAGCTLLAGRQREEMYRVGAAIALQNETDIMLEIRESGPVQGIIKIYQCRPKCGNNLNSHSFYSNHAGLS